MEYTYSRENLPTEGFKHLRALYLRELMRSPLGKDLPISPNGRLRADSLKRDDKGEQKDLRHYLEKKADQFYRILGKAALASSLHLWNICEKEGLDYVNRIGGQISAQAYEAQLFGNLLNRAKDSLDDCEGALDRCFGDLSTFSVDGYLPGSSLASMVLNDISPDKHAQQAFFEAIGKKINNLFLYGKRVKRYDNPNPDPHSVAKASSKLEDLIREAVSSAVSARRN